MIEYVPPHLLNPPTQEPGAGPCMKQGPSFPPPSDPSVRVYIGGLYRHFKGGVYKLRAVASDSSDLKQIAVYQSIKDGTFWTRPLSEFRELLSPDRVPPTGQRRRFAYLCGGKEEWVVP